MRLRVSDRILVAVAGLLLLAACGAIVAQMFFNVDLVSLGVKAFTTEDSTVRALLIVLAALLLLLGIYCVMVLFRHRKRKDKFILQKNDSGELAISIKALENMVQKCLDQHDEIEVQHLYLENKKDGLLIRIRGSVAGGISIPLTVEALQKQIRQYVTACSGVEVRGIRVQIESSGADAENAPFAIAAPAAKPLLKEADEKQTPVQATEVQSVETPARPAQEEEPAVTAPAQETPYTQPVPEEENDDRHLHQRLFSSQPEPCIIPEPPAETETPAGESATGETAPLSGEADAPELDEAAAEPVQSTGSDSAAADQSGTAQNPNEDVGEETACAEKNEGEQADPEFLKSLSEFDKIVTGEKVPE